MAYTLGRDSRLCFSIAFIAIGVGAGSLISAVPPTGPWAGWYRSFPKLWISVGIAVIALIVAAHLANGLRDWSLLLVALSLLAALIGALTIEWGVPYGIRDPWIHLLYTKSGDFGSGNAYPMLHLLIANASEVMGTPTEPTLARTQVLAPALGVVLLTPLLRFHAQNHRMAFALVGIFPIVFIGSVSRPFPAASLFLFTFWLVALRLSNQRKGIVLLAGVLAVSLPWHPVIGVIEELILVSFLAVYYAQSIQLIGRRMQIYNHRLRPHVLVPFFAVLVVFYLVWATQTGPATVGRLAITLFGESTGGVSSTSGGGSTSLLAQVPSALSEFARRMAFVLVLSATTAVALVHEWSSNRFSRPVVVSFIGAIFLGVSFVIIDTIGGVAFGPRRFVPLVPLVLLPAAARGFYYIPTSHLQVGVAILLVSSGLAVVYGSPFTGAVPRSVTQSDTHGVEWLNDHRADGGVIGSQSTYWIVRGRFGDMVAEDWADGNRFSYQWDRRPYDNAWDVPERLNWKYAAVSYPTRFKTQDDPAERHELETFVRQNNRIYDSGNLWWIAE